MVKTSKGKSRLDKFYHLAKEQGFRSRAAFKLIQLNKKYNFFAECRSVLDLCAAPGGWMQVAVKHMPVHHLIVGVDLMPIRPIRGASSLVADITTEKCKKLIEKEAQGRLFDVVLNDGSPNVGGAWHSESISQAILVLDALKLATQFLAPKGWFITKVFRSKDYNALLYVCNQLFGKVEATKPSASRHASAEIFLVCQNYKAPAQIDPKLLDARHVLQEYTTASRMHGPAAMQKKQPKKMHRKFREGYEDGASTTFKSTSIMTFIKAPDPVETLGLYTQFKFEPAEILDAATEAETKELTAEFQTVAEHPKTTDEIRESCQDLLILGKKEFKKLLKWRLYMVKGIAALKPAEKVAEEVIIVDPEERMMKEMAAIQERIEHKAKKRAKKQRQMKKHASKRLAQFKQTEGIAEDSVVDPDLFSLDMFHKETEIDNQRLLSTDPGALELDSESEGSVSDAEADQDDDELKHEFLLESYLEGSYQRYLKLEATDAGLEDVTMKKRKRLDEKGELSEEDDKEMEWKEETEDADEHEDSVKTPGGGLLVKLEPSKAGIATTPDAISAQWFSQELFQDADLVEEETPEDVTIPKLQKADTAEKAEDVMSEASDYEELKDKAATKVKGDSDVPDFEVVKKDEPDVKEEAGGTDTEDEFRGLDVDGKAEILAMARKMLRRKEKENIIDAAYSRFVFHDRDLPKWFERDNDIYNRPQRMVTRVEIEAEKEMLRAMDSRPIKKVAEAKSRKAKRLANRVRAAMKRAEGIANQEELSQRTRMCQMAKVMNTARKKENTKFVTKDQLKKMGRQKRLTAVHKMPLKDKRLKSDRRVRGMGRHAKNLDKIKQEKLVSQQKRKMRRAKR